MKNTPWKAVAGIAAAVAFSLPAVGQTVTSADRTQLTSFFAGTTTDSGGQIEFLTDFDNDTTFNSTLQQAGFRYQSVVGFGNIYDFCADFTLPESDTVTYSVADLSTSALNSTQQDQIRNLFSNAISGFNTRFNNYLALNEGSSAYNAAYDSEYSDVQGYAGGMQVALWEIIHEQVSTLSLEVGDDGVFEATSEAGSPNSRASLALDYGNQFLDSIQGIGGTTWTEQSGYSFYYADGGVSNQPRIWVVPEPATMLLGSFGLLFLIRRRRN